MMAIRDNFFRETSQKFPRLSKTRMYQLSGKQKSGTTNPEKKIGHDSFSPNDRKRPVRHILQMPTHGRKQKKRCLSPSLVEGFFAMWECIGNMNPMQLHQKQSVGENRHMQMTHFIRRLLLLCFLNNVIFVFFWPKYQVRNFKRGKVGNRQNHFFPVMS